MMDKYCNNNYDMKKSPQGQWVKVDEAENLQSLLSEARDLITKPLNSMGVGEKLSWKANIRAFLSKTEGMTNHE